MSAKLDPIEESKIIAQAKTSIAPAVAEAEAEILEAEGVLAKAKAKAQAAVGIGNKFAELCRAPMLLKIQLDTLEQKRIWLAAQVAKDSKAIKNLVINGSVASQPGNYPLVCWRREVLSLCPVFKKELVEELKAAEKLIVEFAKEHGLTVPKPAQPAPVEAEAA